MKNIFSLICGLLFGAGLIISQMANPDKVLSFLDILGSWDPSLAFVMGGAVIVTLIAFPLILKRQKPLLDTQFHMPAKKVIDRALVLGAALFGIGWGLSGYCPGPGITQLGAGLVSGNWADPLMFVIGLFAGSLIYNKLNSTKS
ncbi:MAG TPA: YeeE/YedE family protein [Gammaproteobacteria bacterium]|nr:YeeE/YedE family protein [Gammaproteobacteria bacterium]MEC8009765.1 YeeE/YedE family protein [Pseudomonadota bacterium]HBF09159.1 YeeE/YedE family protein [Gammaproteobacteria bacterium]HCK92463.1 YeeE/YedE family protein [Gammaproteobacteria bacterium]|tara:strand:- start:676 stop:1107 length:432 start_codon:yes stop_codon:yes gene_type:complete